MFLVHVDTLLGARRECSAASGVCREKVPDPRERSSRTACAEVPHARDASEQRRNPAQRAGAATARPRGSRISRDLRGSTGPHGSSGTGTRVCARAGRPGGAGSGARRLPRAAVRGSAGLVDVSPLKLRVLARWHLVPEGRAGVLCKRIHPPHPLSPPLPK